MKFEIDTQTIKDLDLLPNKDKTNSVFTVYNNTLTKGGKDKLLSFIKNPLNNISLLNERKENIRFLCNNSLNIQLNHDQFDSIDFYLRLGRLPLHDNILDSLLDKLKYTLRPNN